MCEQVYVCILCSDISVYIAMYILLDVWWSKNC